jgi:hypothetical protein
VKRYFKCFNDHKTAFEDNFMVGSRIKTDYDVGE